MHITKKRKWGRKAEIYLFSRGRERWTEREKTGKIYRDSIVQDGKNKHRDNKGKHITEVKNKRQMGEEF